MKKKIYIITVAVLAVILLLSAFFVIRYLVDSKQQADRYDQLAQQVSEAETTVATTEAATEPTKPSETTEPTVIAGYQEILDQNADTVGWLKIEGTKLNYPVLQTPENPNFYLDKNFDKQANAHGAIYAREVCDINKPSDNITMYGHNMADGSMFAALNAYVSVDAWKRNSLIFFDTLYEYHTYQIFAVFKTSANLGEGFTYHQFVDAENQQEFDEFVKTCKDLSFYDTGITPKFGDKMICLSTCEYTLNNGRLVVAAVRIS